MLGSFEYTEKDVLVFFSALLLLMLYFWALFRLLLKRKNLTTETRLPRQLLFMALVAVGLVGFVLVLPVESDVRLQLLGLFGLVLTGMIAFSSTTFVSNMMAGLMLRSVKSFRHGDFVRVGQHFGRVTERGLFHTEIQSESRDLITLPNLYLVSNPVTVVRSNGTLISCELSLGYDIPHHQLKPLFEKAVEQTGLSEPFVQILALGDFSVQYKVSGFYQEVKHLLSKRTELQANVLDQLHGAGIEIVSPTFMNQRQLTIEQQFTAPPKRVVVEPEISTAPAEELIFDKAERAEKLQTLREELIQLQGSVKELTASLEKNPSEGEALRQSELNRQKERIALLERIIERAENREEQ